MQAPHAVHSENQIAFAFMSESDIHEPQNGLRGHYALGGGFHETGLVPVILSAVAAGAVVLGLIASNATEPLLLTQVVANDVGPVEEDFEITTGHAKPVSRIVTDGPDALNRASEQAASQTQKRARPAPRAGNSSDLFGLTALTLFGAGLVGLGGWTYYAGAGDIVDTMTGAALALPGVAALLFGIVGYGYGLWRGPEADYSSWTWAFQKFRISDHWSFVRVAYIHNAGYLGGLVGLLVALATIRPKRNQSMEIDVQK